MLIQENTAGARCINTFQLLFQTVFSKKWPFVTDIRVWLWFLFTTYNKLYTQNILCPWDNIESFLFLNHNIAGIRNPHLLVWPWRRDRITHVQHLSSCTWLRVQFHNWLSIVSTINAKFIESENKYFRLGIADPYELMIFRNCLRLMTGC